MSTSHQDPNERDRAFDAAMRGLHAQALANVSPATRAGLRDARHATRETPRHGLWLGGALAAGAAAALVAVVVLPRLDAPGAASQAPATSVATTAPGVAPDRTSTTLTDPPAPSLATATPAETRAPTSAAAQPDAATDATGPVDINAPDIDTAIAMTDEAPDLPIEPATEPAPSPAGGSLAVPDGAGAAFDGDTALAALSEDPELYLWLASDDASELMAEL